MGVLVIKPISKRWKDARDSRDKLYNHPQWYHHWWSERDKIQAEWERLTHIMRQEESSADARILNRKLRRY